MSDYPSITYKKHTFLSALALGLSAIVIAFIVSCTVVIIYGMHFVSDKSEKLASLAEDAIRGLPALQESLPPVLADILDDRRQPDYCTHLKITAKTPLPVDDGRLRTDVTVVNNGEEVVSLLSMRIVVLNARDEILAESNEWVATPFAADDDWRGLLLPGAWRYFSSSHKGTFLVSTLNDLKTEVEITDIRIWRGEEDVSSIDSQVSSETEKSASLATKSAENR